MTGLSTLNLVKSYCQYLQSRTGNSASCSALPHCIMSYGLNRALNFSVRAASSSALIWHLFQSARSGTPASSAAACTHQILPLHEPRPFQGGAKPEPAHICSPTPSHHLGVEYGIVHDAARHDFVCLQSSQGLSCNRRAERTS